MIESVGVDNSNRYQTKASTHHDYTKPGAALLSQNAEIFSE